jgi:hypothetical protein
MLYVCSLTMEFVPVNPVPAEQLGSLWQLHTHPANKVVVPEHGEAAVQAVDRGSQCECLWSLLP